jgi:FkbM family methyltransferase
MFNLTDHPHFRRWRAKYYKWTERPLRVPISRDVATERIGTPYGGWIIPKGWLTADSVCYLAGAGEDVSFDAGIAAQYGCRVDIFDPTPRAVAHVEALKTGISTGQPAPCQFFDTGHYPAYPAEVADLLHIHPYGLWDKTETLRFYAPSDQAHVSHSIVNLQKTEHFIEVPVRRLSEAMQALGHQHLDLLKLDIEGAEYTVLESLVADQLRVDVLCIEYDESHRNHLDRHYLRRIEASLLALVAQGFVVIGKEPDAHNYTLVHRRRLSA